MNENQNNENHCIFLSMHEQYEHMSKRMNNVYKEILFFYSFSISLGRHTINSVNSFTPPAVLSSTIVWLVFLFCGSSIFFFFAAHFCSMRVCECIYVYGTLILSDPFQNTSAKFQVLSPFFICTPLSYLFVRIVAKMLKIERTEYVEWL